MVQARRTSTPTRYADLSIEGMDVVINPHTEFLNVHILFGEAS